MKKMISGGAGTKPLPHLSIRIDLDSEMRIGPGKIELLEQIDRHGSISAAGRAMHMSYKHAWDLVEEMRQTFGRAVVAGQSGGKNGGSTELTPLGRSLIERYRRIEKAAADATREDLLVLRSEVHKPRKMESAQ